MLMLFCWIIAIHVYLLPLIQYPTIKISIFANAQPPTYKPSKKPLCPTGQPSVCPSAYPTSKPTATPTNTMSPTFKPTAQPSSGPSSHPTRQPSRQPSVQPSRYEYLITCSLSFFLILIVCYSSTTISLPLVNFLHLNALSLLLSSPIFSFSVFPSPPFSPHSILPHCDFDDHHQTTYTTTHK